ncbi:MAG: 50S ribosomal protein L18 [Bacilli bacterium]|nr:50S ribosomal protein L18 [Bacilli bacterium]
MIKKESSNSLRLKRHLRIRSKLSGTVECPRLSVYRSNSHIHVQLIDDVKGETLASASTLKMKLKNGSNVEAAKLIGAEIAKLAKEKNIAKVVFDRSGYLYHGRIKALADAARAGGLVF